MLVSTPQVGVEMQRYVRLAVMLLCFMIGVLLCAIMVGRQRATYLQLSPEEKLTELNPSSQIKTAPALTNKNTSNVPKLMLSICSDQATRRGPNQRVVAFSLYGQFNKSRQYFQGIAANYVLVQKMFPGWVVRVYHDISESNRKASNDLNDLQSHFKHLDICNCNNIPGYQSLIGTHQMSWRFLPMADLLVDVFLSRDLDSLISDREVAAVKEWLDSGLTLHVMRDHPLHGVPMLSGMWGARVHTARELLLSLTFQMFVRGRKAQGKGFDQTLLAQVVWPHMIGLVLQHDSYHCKDYAGYGHMRPWPTRRNLTEGFNFVGSVKEVATDNIPLTVCPLECRPA